MLSKRLEKIRSFHGCIESIWDIGCDHGDLGLSFAHLPEVKEINLVDPSPLVMDVLNKKIQAAYIAFAKKIKTHLSKGQNLKIQKENTKTIFIAGMGGKEIGEILDSLSNYLSVNDTIVISPHRKILELRAKLQHSHFRLQKEEIFFEDGEFYQIISLSTDPGFSQVSPYGNISMWRTPWGKIYRDKQIFNFSKHRDSLSKDYVSYLNSISY